MEKPLPMLAALLSFGLVCAPARADTNLSLAQSTSTQASSFALSAGDDRPLPGTWGIGFRGLGPVNGRGQPSVRYIASDRWAFELTPSLSLDYTHAGPITRSKTENFHLYFDVIRKLASYKALDVNFVLEPGFGYNYTRADSPSPVSYNVTYQPTFDLNAGLEFEYFLRRDLSVAGRTLFTYEWQRNANYTPAGSNGRAFNASIAFVGESLNLHYYFSGASNNDDKTVPAAGPGSWALGWQGLGTLYPSEYQPSLKYVWTDKTAFEIVPLLSWSHNYGGVINHFENFTLPIDVERKLWTNGALVMSGVMETRLGTGYNETGGPGPAYTKTKIWIFGIGAGPEFEYFLWPNFSVGARTLLSYTHTRNSNYSQAGYQGLSFMHDVNLEGQVLTTRWYFGGGK